MTMTVLRTPEGWWVQTTEGASRISSSAITTAELLADRSAFEDFDAASYFGGRGFGFVRLQQLATEHLLGAR